VIGADLADSLHVHPGDRVQVFAYGHTADLTVRGIVPRVGVAGFHPGFASRAPNLFVAPGTLEAMAAGALPGSLVPEGRVLVSNVGGVFDSAGPSDAVVFELQIRTAGLGGIQINDEKQQTLAFADQQGRNFSRLFGLIGSFAVAAGVLLLINIFVMLAEERKAELGMLRALGFRRSHLVRVFGLEGTAYSIVAAALGALLGVGVGRIVVQVTEGIFSQGRRGITGLQFAVQPSSLAAGFGIGLLIALVTVWATSARISHLNVIRAIRDSPEPAPARHGARVAVAATAGVVLGALLLAAGISRAQPIPALIGPALVAWCLVPLLTRLMSRRYAISLPGLGLITYTIAAFSLLPSVFGHSDVAVFFVQGIVLVSAGVVIAITNDDQILWVTNRLSASGGGLATRLGLANPLAKRVRTGLLLGMYSLITFALVFMAVFAAVFQAQAPRVTADTAAGYDLRVDSSPGNPITAAQLQQHAGIVAIAPLIRSEAQFQSDPAAADVTQQLTGFDESLLAHGGPTLSSRDPRFGSDADAWQALLTSPDLVIVPENFLATGVGPVRDAVHVGQQVTLINPDSGRRHPLTVVGLDGSLDPAENGAMVAARNLPTLVDSTSASRFYAKVDDRAEAGRIAQELQGSLVANGLKADTFRSLVDDRLDVQAQFISLLEGFLSLGLLIGIAGLGVVMVRAVRERRREIGMLRAMGFASSVVRRSFMVEAAFIAVQGIVIGAALGLVTGYSVLSNSSSFSDESLPFTVPWLALLALAAIALGASLLAVSLPATQASRIKPAVALRISD
jgi:putative ABC transport system permease protein